MAERPILFSTPMVRRVLDGSKTVTRRVVKMPSDTTRLRPAQGGEAPQGAYVAYWEEPGGAEEGGTAVRCPYGAPGDRLWVKEAVRFRHRAGRYTTVYLTDGTELEATADGAADTFGRATWKQVGGDHWLSPRRPPHHMPRWASRITLEVTDVAVEQVQDITEDEARAEGVFGEQCDHKRRTCAEIGCIGPNRAAFADLWDSINAKRGHGWDANPWVWVVRFKVVRP